MPATPTHAFETLQFDVRGTAAWLVLDRPQAMNSVSPRMLEELDAALDIVARDAALRSVVLTGRGRAFCAGADLLSVRGLGEAAARDFADAAHALLQRIEAFPLPVIAAVNGLALAGGLELVLACDLVVAAREARFGDAHAKLGLLPGWGATARLPRRIGVARAKQMMFTAQQVPADTLAGWGLVHEVVPADALEAAVLAWCAQLADKSPLGLRRMKQLLGDSLEQPLPVALRAERAMLEAHAHANDRREGLEAFAQKRTPRFTGT